MRKHSVRGRPPGPAGSGRRLMALPLRTLQSRRRAVAGGSGAEPGGSWPRLASSSSTSRLRQQQGAGRQAGRVFFLCGGRALLPQGCCGRHLPPVRSAACCWQHAWELALMPLPGWEHAASCLRSGACQPTLAACPPAATHYPLAPLLPHLCFSSARSNPRACTSA